MFCADALMLNDHFGEAGQPDCHASSRLADLEIDFPNAFFRIADIGGLLSELRCSTAVVNGAQPHGETYEYFC